MSNSTVVFALMIFVDVSTTYYHDMITRFLKKGRYARRIGSDAPAYLAAVLEYLASEVLELAGNAAQDNYKKRIKPRHVQLAVRNDTELDELLAGVTIARGGVMPNIHSAVLPKY
ncbi:hypothetical protein L1987_14236 [Smallanthus sonchifolius]|uniref:Uncharacterized protein n=1 Tax=Smallanthus sonchifolius TaxID=185202 RepID=A0ACB9J391_9ASTR|nr:hypothetical protein L1987_14236 [Smallanthus sonchifolius]